MSDRGQKRSEPSSSSRPHQRDRDRDREYDSDRHRRTSHKSGEDRESDRRRRTSHRAQDESADGMRERSRRKSSGRDYDSHRRQDSRVSRGDGESSSHHRSSRRDERDEAHRHRSRNRSSSKVKERAWSQSPSLPGHELRRSEGRPSHPDDSRLEAPPAAPGPEDGENATAPNFKPSGLLAAESNQKNGVALKYHEPPEARKPKHPWRLYAYKDGKEQEMIILGAQSAYLLGRDRTVVDIPVDHPSCSKQHAVIQFRQTIETNEFGDHKKRIRPYLIDLESANGCEVNEREIPASRYYEIKNADTIHFGASTREYVMLDEGAV